MLTRNFFNDGKEGDLFFKKLIIGVREFFIKIMDIYSGSIYIINERYKL